MLENNEVSVVAKEILRLIKSSELVVGDLLNTKLIKRFMKIVKYGGIDIKRFDCKEKL